MSAPRTWSREEVEEILRRALERQQSSETAREGTSHDDLVAAAREVGIDPADLEAAAAELEREKEKPAALVEKAIAPKHSPARRFLRNLATYAVVNGFLLGIDVAGGPGFWVQWVALGWGLALALQAVKLLIPGDDDAEREARRVARRADREARRAQIRALSTRAERKLLVEVGRALRDPRRRTHHEFEEAVEAGVLALLNAATRHAQRMRAEREGRFRFEEEPRRVRVESDDDADVPSHLSPQAGRGKRRKA